MKKLSLILSLLFFHLSYAQQDWEAVGKTAFSPQQAQGIQIEMINGTPYVAYEDQGFNYRGTVEYFDGATWQILGDHFSSGEARYISLTSDGTYPWVAYTTSSFQSTLFVARFDGNNWITVGNTSLCNTAIHPSIKIYNGEAYVAYTDASLPKKNSVLKRFDGTNWVQIGSDFPSNATETIENILVVKDGTPYVLYYSVTDQGAKGAEVSYFDGSSWKLLGNAKANSESVDWKDMIFYKDQPFISFRDDHSANGNATVMTLENNQWKVVGDRMSAGKSSDHTSLSTDGENLYLSYVDGTVFPNGNYDLVTVKKFDGTDWTTLGNEYANEHDAPHADMIYGGDGYVYVAYASSEDIFRSTVKRICVKDDCIPSGDCGLMANFETDNTCFGMETSFTSTSTDQNNTIINWIWDFGDGNTASGSETVVHEYETMGTYEVTLIVENNRPETCRDTLIRKINIELAPERHIDEEVIKCKGDFVVIKSGVENENMLWDNGLNARERTIRQAGKYWIEVWNSCGARTDTFKVVERDCGCELYIPNTFTPNQDEINDYFKIEYDCQITEFSVEVFTRWGDPVFYSEDSNFIWDGTFENNDLQQGSYAYRIQYTYVWEDEIVEEEKRGFVFLMR